MGILFRIALLTFVAVTGICSIFVLHLGVTSRDGKRTHFQPVGLSAPVRPQPQQPINSAPGAADRTDALGYGTSPGDVARTPRGVHTSDLAPGRDIARAWRARWSGIYACYDYGETFGAAFLAASEAFVGMRKYRSVLKSHRAAHACHYITWERQALKTTISTGSSRP